MKFVLIVLAFSVSACDSRPQAFHADDDVILENNARLKECPKSHANKSRLQNLKESGASRAAIFREAAHGLDARLACEYQKD